jgi:hypothetical protein
MIRDHGLQLAHAASQLPRHRTFRNENLLELSVRLEWVRARDDGVAVLSPRGELILETPTASLKLRRALIDYVEIEKPQWMALVLDGRARFMTFAPVEFRQTVAEAYLAEGYDADVIAFWDLLAEIARGERAAALSQIGRRGERLTMDFEKLRTGRDPVWRAIESNSDGYDVLSVMTVDNLAKRPIEVKTSMQGLNGAAHLTRNEWEQTGLIRNHTFHLWDLSVDGRPLIAVLDRADVAVHIPADTGSGKWKEVEIPFAVFADTFKQVAEALPPPRPDTYDWSGDPGEDPM